MGQPPVILFTAFEPSGDILAAAAITELRALRPDLEVWAMGGPRTQAAGARMIAHTVGDAAMGVGAIRKLFEHRARVRMLRQWLARNRIGALVPTDSPAANWAVCRLVRRLHPRARIIHLVAPQLWAWASWRIRRLRRLSDHVLCLLPFEVEWFARRGVSGTFVGHPVFDRIRGLRAGPPSTAALPEAPLKLALLPGSRPGEIAWNWPGMLRAFEDLSRRHPGLVGVVAGADDDIARRIDAVGRQTLAGRPWPANLHLKVGVTDAALAWADVVLVVSGTAALEVAAFRRPMVVVFRSSRWTWWLLGWWLIHIRSFSLPNLIAVFAGRPRVVPEFAPHFGGHEPWLAALDPLLRDPAARARMLADLEWVCAQFDGVSYRTAAAGRIVELLGESGSQA